MLNDSKSRRLSARAVLIIVLLTTGALSVGVQGNDDASKFLGDWRGESICIGSNPSCHDEQVIYHISKSATAPGMLTIDADKIINGKPEQMYVLDFKYDSERGTLTGEFKNARYHGLWEYTVKGDLMEGTLSLLPEKKIVRRVKVKKEER